MELKSSLKIFNNYKCDYPENTIKRIQEGLKKIGLNPKYNEKEVASKDFSSYSGELLIEELGFYTTGKGTSPILAKASAYAEMSERISSGFFVFRTITDKLVEYNKLLEDVIERKFLKNFFQCSSFNSVDLEKINKYLEEEISRDEFLVFSNQGLFDNFVDSYSFIDGKYVEVPVRLIELLSGSTGLASGNTIEEALVQGACEILERYAAYKILSKKIECPTIRIESIDDDIVHSYVNLFNSMNIEVIVKDFSLGKGLPVVGVIFINRNIEDEENELKKNRYYKMIDVGSHIDLSQAVIRCFTERLQGLTKEEFMYREKCDILYDLWTKSLKKRYVRTNEVFKDLFIDYEFRDDISFLERGKEVSFNELESTYNTDCLDDCNALINICQKNNWPLQVIDYTHRVLKFPTLRVIIPPISTSIEPHIFKSLKIENFEEKFNFLYGINNFYRYVTEDNWIKNCDEIKILISDLEKFLSRNLLSFRFCIRQGHFLYPINLLHILAFCNLAIGKYENSLEYFKALLELDDKPPYYTPYFNILLNPGYNPSLYSVYTELIKMWMEKNNTPKFQFQSNPFKPKSFLKESEHFFYVLLTNLSKSFFD